MDGLLDGSLGFGGEASAGASFLRLDGGVCLDKDGIIPTSPAAEITTRRGRDSGEICQELTREFGEPVYAARVEAPATPEQKAQLARLSPEKVDLTELAGEKIVNVLCT